MWCEYLTTICVLLYRFKQIILSGEGQWSCRHFVQGPGIWSSRKCSKRLQLLPSCAAGTCRVCGEARGHHCGHSEEYLTGSWPERDRPCTVSRHCSCIYWPVKENCIVIDQTVVVRVHVLSVRTFLCTCVYRFVPYTGVLLSRAEVNCN